MAHDYVPEHDKTHEQREKEQGEIVVAWNELDKREKKLTADKARLGTSSAPNLSASDKIDLELKRIGEQKATLEESWKKKFPALCRIFRNIENWVKKYQAEELVEGTQTREQLIQLEREIMAFYEDDQTPALAVQRLFENKLMPSDLKGGSHVREAALAVFPGPMGKELQLRLKVPASAEYNNTVAELSAFADMIQLSYDELVKLNLAKDQLAESTIDGFAAGKVGKVVKEIGKNKFAMGLGVAGLIVTAIFGKKLWGGLKDGPKTWLLGLLGIGTIAGAAAVITDKGDDKNIGLWDKVQNWLGMDTDSVLAPDVLDQTKRLFADMPKDDRDVVDDFIRVVGTPMDKITSVFDKALRGHVTEVDTASLVGPGLSSKEYKPIDGGSLYTGLRWFFLECYEKGNKDGELPNETSEDAKAKRGVEWARKQFSGHKLGSALIAMEVVRTEGETPAGTVLARERIAGLDPNLRKLSEAYPILAEALVPTGEAGVVRVKGYPYEYHYSEKYDHVFKGKVPSGGNDTTINAALEGDDLYKALKDFVESSTQAVSGLIDSAYTFSATLRYGRSGLWELSPGESRNKPQGLPHHLEDKKVPVVFFWDKDKEKFMVDMDTDHNGSPDKGPKYPYGDVSDVVAEYERLHVLKPLVVKNLSHVLLTVKVTDLTYQDVGATETKVTIQYGSNRQGEVIYENDQVKSFTLGAAPFDATLEKAWEEEAGKRIAEFLLRKEVQAELLKVTGTYTPDTLGGWMTTIGEWFKDGIQWLKDDQIMDRFHTEQEKQVVRKMRELVYNPVHGMAADYVTDLFKKFYPEAQFHDEAKKFFENKLTFIKTGVVGATVIPEKEADIELAPGQAVEMCNRQGRTAIQTALSPLRYQTPSTSPSLFVNLIRGAINTVSGDAVRTEYYEDRVAVYMQDLQTRVDRLASLPAVGAPAGTIMPTQPTLKEVEAEIAKIQIEAQQEALNYWGKTNPDAIQTMMLAPIERAAHKADWEPATRLVATYMTNSLKWENYGFLPNPENMARIMRKWYEGIGNAAAAPKSATEADAFAKYFIWETWARMGGHKDFSPDRLYNDTIESVSDSQFKANIAAFESSVMDYATWSASPVLAVRPPVPGMEPAIEKYRETLKAQLDDWFEDYAAVGGLFTQDRHWPEMFKKSFDDRYNTLAARATTVTQLATDVTDFKRFILAERYIIYESLIVNHVKMPLEGVEVSTDVINDFWTYFDGGSGHLGVRTIAPRDLNGYMANLKLKMKDVLTNIPGPDTFQDFDTYYKFPDIPFIPFI